MKLFILPFEKLGPSSATDYWLNPKLVPKKKKSYSYENGITQTEGFLQKHGAENSEWKIKSGAALQLFFIL